MSEKTKGEELREKLFYQPKNLSEVLSPEEKAEAENFSVPYKRFLDHAKTEREAVSTIVELLEKAGRKRGFVLRGGEIDTERMAKILLDEFRGGKLGRFTLEMPEDV